LPYCRFNVWVSTDPETNSISAARQGEGRWHFHVGAAPTLTKTKVAGNVSENGKEVVSPVVSP
jgi:hypothetical protein